MQCSEQDINNSTVSDILYNIFGSDDDLAIDDLFDLMINDEDENIIDSVIDEVIDEYTDNHNDYIISDVFGSYDNFMNWIKGHNTTSWWDQIDDNDSMLTQNMTNLTIMPNKTYV